MRTPNPHPKCSLAPAIVVLLAALAQTVFAEAPTPDQRSQLWPPVTIETKPWAYWHWPGSAVDETNLVRELNRYSHAGLGGMHIIPIYGAKGWEDRYIPYLSPRWMEVMGAAVREARRLQMNIDMTTGTGWNFGGPNITPELSCMRLDRKSLEVPEGTKPPALANRADVLAVLAESNNGTNLDLTERVSSNGEVDWVAPGPGWKVLIITILRGQPEVERAAPGGEGPLLNPFYRAAMDHYLIRFQEAFADSSAPKPRAMYNDSYEYHGAAWSPDLYEQFAWRRGYRLEAHRAELFGTATDDTARRVRADYRETLSDLLLESMTEPWVAWSHREGFLTRNQAHGSPGNLLDLYAAADIPETEMFSKDRDILVSKFASSAAHVAGHHLVSAETGTWVAEHFTETLADLKRNVDDLFVSGVNHVFYHGTCYSPDEAPWPGWLFYASTQMNPRNSIWQDVPALNAYVQRCQSLLQSGSPDNDVLLYWPIHDLWHQEDPLVAGLTVHHREWLQQQSVGRVARQLWSRGWNFDYISDRQLMNAKGDGSQVSVPGGKYRVVVVPDCEHMPVQTLQRLIDLAEEGVTVVFENKLPGDVPGFFKVQERRSTLQTMVSVLPLKTEGKLRRGKVRQGNILVGDLEGALESARVRRETLTDHEGLLFVRRTLRDARLYYILNKGSSEFAGWLPLAVDASAAALLDPMTSRVGLAACRAGHQALEVYLQLQPGEAMFVSASTHLPRDLQPWAYLSKIGAPQELSGSWKIKFILGGPDLPPDITSSRLASWTELGGEAAQRFAGTARYTLSFDAPTSGKDFLLTLGRVAQSARVRLNGNDLGTLFMAPFQVRLADLKPAGNILEVEVTSVAANRIRDLDRRGVKWKNFHDINFVNINYQPFDASNWPLHDAGLLGPVTLQPVTVFTPHE